jgi:cytoskeletal protein RodZ
MNIGYLEIARSVNMQAENSGQSKLFVVLVVSLVGLLVLGLLGIGGVFVLRKNIEGQQTVASRPTPTLVIKLPPAPSPTSAIPTVVNTPAPTPTSTPVIQVGNKAAEAAAMTNGQEMTTTVKAEGDANAPTPKASPTATVIAGKASANNPVGGGAGPAENSAASATTVPKTGLDATQTILLAVGLVTVLLVARRLRTA